MVKKLKNIKLRKYEIKEWMVKKSITSRNSWTVARCCHCLKWIRSNKWEEHPNKCIHIQSLTSNSLNCRDVVT